MKNIGYAILFSLGILFFIGCTAPSHRLMPAVQYHDSIPFHVPKKAYLYWDNGSQYAHEIEPTVLSGADLLTTSIALMIAQQNKKNHPSEYSYQYGDAQQVIFITSLKDILIDNRVFNQVEIITNLNQVKPEDVLIKINFDLTRVNQDIKIILDVKMVIENEGHQFKRSYFIQNDEGTHSFRDRQINVSDKLVRKIIHGIQEWSENQSNSR